MFFCSLTKRYHSNLMLCNCNTKQLKILEKHKYCIGFGQKILIIKCIKNLIRTSPLFLKIFCYQHCDGWIENKKVDGGERRDDMQPTVWLDVCDVLKYLYLHLFETVLISFSPLLVRIKSCSNIRRI